MKEKLLQSSFLACRSVQADRPEPADFSVHTSLHQVNGWPLKLAELYALLAATTAENDLSEVTQQRQISQG